MTLPYNIRMITPADAEAALEVYAPYVLTTANSFEYEVPTVQTFKERIEKITSKFPWLVCEYNGKIIAYAYSSAHHDRIAYQWSTDVTVYMKEAYHRKGIARILYNALFAMLKMQGYYTLYANVLSTNVKSYGFHKAMGFEDIGLYKNIGFKLGEWQTNIGMQYFLQAHKPEPHTPTPALELMNTDVFRQILAAANERVNKTS